MGPAATMGLGCLRAAMCYRVAPGAIPSPRAAIPSPRAAILRLVVPGEEQAREDLRVLLPTEDGHLHLQVGSGSGSELGKGGQLMKKNTLKIARLWEKGRGREGARSS